MHSDVVRAAVLSAVVSLGYLTSVSAVSTVTGVDAQLESTWTRTGSSWDRTVGDPSTDAIGVNGEVYKNNTNFLGTGFSQGPGGLVTGPAGTNVQTLHTWADDLTLDPASTVGDKIIRFSFSVVNFNAAARTVRPHVSFYLNDGASGGPGTLVAAFLFNPVSVNASSVSNFSFVPTTAQQWSIPANRFFWAAESFDNGGGATASNAELENFGQGLFNPPTIGSSQDLLFASTNPDDAFTSNPAGSTGTLGGNPPPVSNTGWELRVAPEPGSLTLIGVAGTGLLLRRRRA